MSMTFEEKVVDAFQASSAALVRYEKMATEKQAQEVAVSKEIPDVVDALLRFGRIDLTEKEACARALRDPVQALHLMRKLAEHRNAAEDATLGQPVDASGRPAAIQKRASDDRFAGGGYVGRRTGDEPESWRRLKQGIGLG